MAVFPSKRYGPKRYAFGLSIRKHPVLFFGLPFVSIIVGASFALQTLTRTRYDLQKQRSSQISKEEEMHMSKNRKKVDIREEYYRLQSPGAQEQLDDWEPVRIARPAGTPEWGVPPPHSPSTSSEPESPTEGFGRP